MPCDRKFQYKKILIVGNSGAGKTTLAVQLGKLFGLHIVFLDKLWWLPDWKTREKDEFDRLLLKELEKPEWIIEGNYRRTFPTRLKYADFCIFLDYDYETCFQGVLKRSNKYKGKNRPDMVKGCKETGEVDKDFADWIKGYKEKEAPLMKELIENSGVEYKIFTSREETRNWLENLS